jgi:hypothetical protein
VPDCKANFFDDIMPQLKELAALSIRSSKNFGNSKK